MATIEVRSGGKPEDFVVITRKIGLCTTGSISLTQAQAKTLANVLIAKLNLKAS